MPTFPRDLQIIQIHKDYQELFNTVIDEYIKLANHWTETGLYPFRNVWDLEQYGNYWFSFPNSEFYQHYKALMEAVPSFKTIMPGETFKWSVQATFDMGMKIPLYNRPNSIPYDLHHFIVL